MSKNNEDYGETLYYGLNFFGVTWIHEETKMSIEILGGKN